MRCRSCDAFRLSLNHFEIGLCHSNYGEDLSIFFNEIRTNIFVILTKEGPTMTTVVNSIIYNKVNQGQFDTALARDSMGGP